MNKNIKLVLFGVLFFLVFYILTKMVFWETETVCAKVKYEGGTKGIKSIVYVYKYKGKTYSSSFDSSAGICLDIECYQNKECLDVEVSTLLPFLSRVKVSKPK